MVTLLAQDYVEAVRQILNGNHVGNLEYLRARYNQQFKGHSSTESYTADTILVSFAADAENKILHGCNPDKAYASVKIVKPETFRQLARDTLEDFVKYKSRK